MLSSQQLTSSTNNSPVPNSSFINMNALFVLALLVAGTQAGFLHAPAPAIYAATAPVAVASPVLTATYPAYSVHSPIAHHVGSSFAAPALYAAPAVLPAAPFLKTHHLAATPIYAGTYAAPGLLYRK